MFTWVTIVLLQQGHNITVELITFLPLEHSPELNWGFRCLQPRFEQEFTRMPPVFQCARLLPMMLSPSLSKYAGDVESMPEDILHRSPWASSNTERRWNWWNHGLYVMKCHQPFLQVLRVLPLHVSDHRLLSGAWRLHSSRNAAA